MTRSTRISFCCLLSLIMVAACSKTVQKSGSEGPASSAGTPQLKEDKPIASVDVVKATAQPVEVSPGGSAELLVRLSIQDGYHVNANPPTYSYLKATELEIATSEGVSAGHIVYPKALIRKFAFAEKPLAVYEGETELKAALSADKAAKQGQQSLAAKLRIQACDEAVCYAPGTLNLLIPVNVK